jgi:hypothetical protein
VDPVPIACRAGRRALGEAALGAFRSGVSIKESMRRGASAEHAQDRVGGAAWISLSRAPVEADPFKEEIHDLLRRDLALTTKKEENDSSSGATDERRSWSPSGDCVSA